MHEMPFHDTSSYHFGSMFLGTYNILGLDISRDHEISVHT